MKKPLQCNQCDYVGAHKDHLQAHFNSVHLKKCSKCGSCFSTGYELSKHMKWDCVKKCKRCKIILPHWHYSEVRGHSPYSSHIRQKPSARLQNNSSLWT